MLFLRRQNNTRMQQVFFHVKIADSDQITLLIQHSDACSIGPDISWRFDCLALACPALIRLC